MTDFSLICIGAHTGFWIENLVKEHSKKEIKFVSQKVNDFFDFKLR